MATTRADIEHRVTYHPPSPAAREAHERMRHETAQFAQVALAYCPPSPELDAALRTLTDVVLAQLNAAIARNHDTLPLGVTPSPA